MRGGLIRSKYKNNAAERLYHSMEIMFRKYTG